MRVLAWLVAAMFVALAGLSAWGIIASVRRLRRVPRGRQGSARLILVAGFAGCLARLVAAAVVVLATYDVSGNWKVPVVVILGVTLIGAVPGIGVYLWRHHEPWIQEWRRGEPS